jgi:hypothetical protein
MNLETNPKNDLWVFREGRKSVTGTALLADLEKTLANTYCARDPGVAISALMRAGEFESAIADANSPAQSQAEELTDALATAFVEGTSGRERIRVLLDRIGHFQLPEQLGISPPEGFAYYALHPHDFARLALQVETGGDCALVIGIRSIGTTLSAIVRAALHREGKKTGRITVRPSGHPYERALQFSPAQLQIVSAWRTMGADCLVVDEGPGRSGSSFLSVAEALVKAGIPHKSIRLLGSRPVDVNQLCAENARERWAKFTFLSPEPSVYARFSNHLYVGGGSWRGILLGGHSHWPACWPQMERLKFLSPDHRFLFKFEGFGQFGEEVLSRAHTLARAGFGCLAHDADDGMVCYPVIQGPVADTTDVSRQQLTALARYCAFRAVEFRNPDAPASQLPAMLGFNTLHEFGVDLGSEIDELCTREPILTDGRMQPHEWIRQPGGNFVKVDAYTHGDDHFFPGPTDIAWDLAGAMVEWNLDKNGAEFLLSEFRRISGIDRTHAISAFVLGYTVFRLAYFKMALSTVQGSVEEPPIRSAYLHYRALAEQQLRDMRALNRHALKAVPPAAPVDSSIQTGTAA